MNTAIQKAASDQRLQSTKGFVFDLDGTLGLTDKGVDGFRLLPGALDFLSMLKRQGIPFVIFTNGTFFPPIHYVEVLEKSGITIDLHQMLTPSVIAAEILSDIDVKRVLVLGGEGVWKPLLDRGLNVVFPSDTDADKAEAVYVGWHPELQWRDIEVAAKAIWNGASVYSASLARFFAAKNGKKPGISAAIIAALQNITDCSVAVTGKPDLDALKLCQRLLGGIPLSDMAVVGDDPALEPVFAHAGGCVSIAVTTGLGSRDDFIAMDVNTRPHFIFNDINELQRSFIRC